MAKPPSRARQEAIYRRRRQSLLVVSSLLMGSLGALAGVASRHVLPATHALFGGGTSLKKPVNVLLVGVDDNYDPSGRKVKNRRTRTDTIMLVTVRPAKKSLHVLSIPRDTQVLIPGYGTEKINAAHAIGGLDRTKAVVESLVDVEVDHAVEVSLRGAIQFLDELGGVDVFVENRMHYEDKTAKLLIDLKPGMQHLDGKTAVGFARFRHDAMGDIGRVARQQALLHALEQKLVNPVNWWRLPKLASAAGQLFTSDFTAGDYASLAAFAKDKPAVSYTTLPGDFGYHGYWIPNHGRIAALMQSLNNDRQSAPKAGGGAPVAVEVLYGPSQEQAATKLAGVLGERGLMVVRTAPVTHHMSTATRVIGRNGNPHQNSVLTGLMPQAAWQLSDDESPYSADYTVVIGPDYR